MPNRLELVGAVFAAIAALLGPQSASADGNLVLYCAVQEEWCRNMVAAFERQTGIKVAMTRKSSGEFYAQVQAEASNPRGTQWAGHRFPLPLGRQRPTAGLLHRIGSAAAPFWCQVETLSSRLRVSQWDAPGYGASTRLATEHPDASHMWLRSIGGFARSRSIAAICLVIRRHVDRRPVRGRAARIRTAH